MTSRPDGIDEDALDAKWLGILLTYEEQDFPTSKPYMRTIPGWQCRGCGEKIGTSNLPPRECPNCRARWR